VAQEGASGPVPDTGAPALGWIFSMPSGGCSLALQGTDWLVCPLLSFPKDEASEQQQ